MRHNLRRFVLFVAPLALFAGLSVSQSAQQQNGSVRALTFSNLTLEIATTNKKEFVKLEPMPITLTLSNKTTQTILGHGTLGFSANLVKLFVARGDGKGQEIQQLSPFPEEVFIKPIEMKPGDGFHTKELLSLNLDNIFPQPGEYQIYAVLFDPNSKREVKSNKLTVQILQPEGIDRQAFEFIQTNSRSANLLSGRYLSGNQRAQNALEMFVQIFDKSVYGDYASFLLGELYFTQEEYNRAAEQFNKVANKADFVLADRAQKYLVEAREKQKE